MPASLFCLVALESLAAFRAGMRPGQCADGQRLDDLDLAGYLLAHRPQKGVERQAAFGDLLKAAFPVRRCQRVFQCRRNQLDQLASQRRGDNFLAVHRQQPDFQQILQHGGPCGVRADALCLPERILGGSFGIDVPMHVLHRVQKRAVREPRRRRRLFLRYGHILAGDAVPFLYGGQRRLIRRFFFGERRPAGIDDAPARRLPERVAEARLNDPRLIAHGRVELERVVFADQGKDFLLVIRKIRRRLPCGDDAVMRRQFGGVPGGASQRGVRLGGDAGHMRQRPGKGGQRGQNARAFRLLVFRQIAAVRAGIGSQLRQVQRLRGIKHLLCRHAVL